MESTHQLSCEFDESEFGVFDSELDSELDDCDCELDDSEPADSELDDCELDVSVSEGSEAKACILGDERITAKNIDSDSIAFIYLSLYRNN